MRWLDVPIHLQDDHTLCAQACAQMVSRFFELTSPSGGPPVIRDQRSFDGGPGTKHFTTNPAQLARMINGVLPPNAAQYRDYVTKTAEEALGIARASIDADYPAVMLVDAGDHWEVVSGHSPLGVHVRNPAPDRTTLNPGRTLQPHDDNDDGCATLGELKGTAGTDGDELYTVAGWLRRTNRPVSFEDAPWYGHYVVVARQNITPTTWTAPSPTKANIQESDLHQLALRAVVNSDLLMQRSVWSNFDRQHLQSRYVRVETDEGPSYYLVDVKNHLGQSVLVGLDSVTGELLWARLNPANRSLRQIERAMSGRARWTPRHESGFSPFLPDVETDDGPTR